MDIMQKLEILTDSAKYDVACTSSGSDREGKEGGIGNTSKMGICHSFSADGRCISLLKVLMTNYCTYDCKYCVNRSSNDVQRTAFTPDELAELTIEFYKRNYIEGLFLSSGIVKNPDNTMELMCKALSILRNEYRFNGYIHAKAIPGASPELIDRLGLLADRISVNIEMPSEASLSVFAPNKTKENILKPMGAIRDRVKQSKNELAVYRHAPSFANAGQSTQMIIGATPDTDWQILRLSEGLYKKYELKRVFYSAYIPVGTHELLPKNIPPPLLREHRLYQADWLLRFYGFEAGELLSQDSPSLDPLLDPKCQWALRNLDNFPVEINRADKETLLRVPGIGVTGVLKILKARRYHSLSFDDLRKMRIVLKRAAYFITCNGKMMEGVSFKHSFIYQNLIADTRRNPRDAIIGAPRQESLFDSDNSLKNDNMFNVFQTNENLTIQDEELPKSLAGSKVPLIGAPVGKKFSAERKNGDFGVCGEKMLDSLKEEKPWGISTQQPF